MKRPLIILAAIASLALTSTSVLADDLTPPWWRDNENAEDNRSTYQEWWFGDNGVSSVIPDEFTNPPNAYTDPPPLIELGAFVTLLAENWISGPVPEPQGRSGIWPLSESAIMSLTIPNYSQGPEKKIWIQLTWMPQIEHAVPTLSVLTSPFTPVPTIAPVAGLPVGNGWMHSKYLIVVQPNPEFEMITITGDIMIDEVIVDTICPEPATMLLLGLAVPFVLKRRRRN